MKIHICFYKQLLDQGTIFARMSPDQKQQLIELLQAEG